MNAKRKPAGTVNLMPTWEAVLPIYLMALTHGNAKGHAAAAQELKRMAQAADKWNAHLEAQKETQ